MIERINNGKSLVELTFEQLQTDFVDERYEDSLCCAGLIYLMSRNDADSRYKSAAIAFMYESSKAIYGKKDSETGSSKRRSFCSKAHVLLGAGHAAYICNECVGLFADTLNQRPRDGSR